MEEFSGGTEEPYPGWQRYEVAGQRPYYKTPVPRTVIRSAAMLKEFLDKEKKVDRMRDVDVSKFSFKRRHGIKRDVPSSSCNVNSVTMASNKVWLTEVAEASSVKTPDEQRDVVDLLTRETDKIVDHKKLLSNTSKQIDAFRSKNGTYHASESFQDLKKNLSSASDLRDIVAFLSKDQDATEALTATLSDMCLAEICQIDTKRGPLVEFPSSINENVYCKIVEQGLQYCPHLITMIINLVVRKGEPVLPSHVLKIATMFSSLCHLANHDLDALVKIRSLTMQMDGLNNQGLNLLSDCGLSQCARSLSNHRDVFADVGRAVVDNTASNFPFQSLLDNCDINSEHLTVEVIEKECIDTTNLCTVAKSKEEALALFTKEQVLLGSDQNQDELEHFRYVVGVAVGRVLASRRSNAKVLGKYLPSHHTHSHSDQKLSPALTFILKPYPYQETKTRT